MTVPKKLQEVEGIYGGYIVFTPTGSTASVEVARRKGRTAAAAPSNGPVTLSVPYQGSTKDYSTVDADNSLVLFVPALYDVDPTAAEALEQKPPLFLCDIDGAGKCGYAAASLKAPLSTYKGYRFASTLLRPVADVKVQVGSRAWTWQLCRQPACFCETDI